MSAIAWLDDRGGLPSFVRDAGNGAVSALLGRDREQPDDEIVGFTASSASSDRMGDVVFQRWELDPFRANPVSLFQHQNDRPIGTVPRIGVQGGALRAGIRFDPLVPDGWVGAAVQRGTLAAVSVGFKPGGIESRARLPKDDRYYVDDEWWRAGFVFGRIGAPNELLELSVVTVPANRDATRLSVDGAAELRTTTAGVPAYRVALYRQAIRDMAAEQRRNRASDPDWLAKLGEHRQWGREHGARKSEGLPWLGEVPWLR